MNLYGDPSCTFPAFASHLAGHSPAAPEARAIWAVLTAHRVDPAVALGLFHHESNCGTRGRAASTKSWGNIRYLARFAELAYAVRDAGGFASYPTWTTGALHFCEHLLGLDGTANYRGLTTLEQVIPIWAPPPTNDPAAYIAAVEDFASSFGKVAVTKIAVVAGHLRCENITADGLRAERDVAMLRTMTGTSGERAYTGDFATRLANALTGSGLVEGRALDCTFDRGVYVDWKPDGVIALHYHRDHNADGSPRGRAMFAAPDPGFGFQSEAARADSLRFVARLYAGYSAATGIPTTPGLETIGMRQLYTWDYLPASSWAACLELGNADVDGAVLYSATDRLTPYLRDAVLAFLDLLVIPPAPPQISAKEQLARDLESLAARVRTL